MAHPASGSKRAWLIAVGVVVFMAIAFLPDWQRRPVPVVVRPLAGVYALASQAVSSTVGWVTDTWAHYVAVTTLYDANALLRADVDRLTRERDALREVLEENRRLTGLLDFRTALPASSQGARVIGRDPSRWYQSVTIDRGSHDAAVVDMGVAVPGGVVGTVIKVFPSAAVVLLITDRQSAVPAIVQRTREQGIVEGTMAGRLRLKYLPPSSEIREGDVILTSGLTPSFPKGLMVGTVTRVAREESALYPEVEVLPSADLSALEEVLVFELVPAS
jgi:rod shape-determining protein MreC